MFNKNIFEYNKKIQAIGQSQIYSNYFDDPQFPKFIITKLNSVF